MLIWLSPFNPERTGRLGIAVGSDKLGKMMPGVGGASMLPIAERRLPLDAAGAVGKDKALPADAKLRDGIPRDGIAREGIPRDGIGGSGRAPRTGVGPAARLRSRLY